MICVILLVKQNSCCILKWKLTWNCNNVSIHHSAIIKISFCHHFFLSILQAEIARQEARLKMERDNLEKEKSVLMGTASNQDNQDGALEITVSGEKYRCLRFAKAKK